MKLDCYNFTALWNMDPGTARLSPLSIPACAGTPRDAARQYHPLPQSTAGIVRMPVCGIGLEGALDIDGEMSSTIANLRRHADELA